MTTTKRKKRKPLKKNVLQFRITLTEIKPKIWRRILVPETYSMWDLHVAIQDSMGWLDYHLHRFSVLTSDDSGEACIGLPVDDFFDEDAELIASWDALAAFVFERPGDEATYEYDFGDGWVHTVELEAVLLAEPKRRYPTCIGGERRCPPEDCGGPHGYQEMLKTLRKGRGEQYDTIVKWLGGGFDAEDFDPTSVRFDDPRVRLQRALRG